MSRFETLVRVTRLRVAASAPGSLHVVIVQGVLVVTFELRREASTTDETQRCHGGDTLSALARLCVFVFLWGFTATVVNRQKRDRRRIVVGGIRKQSAG